MTDRAIVLKITREGMRALFNATNTGAKLQLSHIGIGASVGGAGYIPVGTETALRAEFQRAPIGGGDYVSDFEIAVQALFDGAPQGWIWELGVYATPENEADTPVLFALWSDLVAPLAHKTTGVPFIAAATLALSEIPPNSLSLLVAGANVNITIDSPLALFAAEIMRLQMNVNTLNAATATADIDNKWW